MLIYADIWRLSELNYKLHGKYETLDRKNVEGKIFSSQILYSSRHLYWARSYDGKALCHLAKYTLIIRNFEEAKSEEFSIFTPFSLFFHFHLNSSENVTVKSSRIVRVMR